MKRYIFILFVPLIFVCCGHGIDDDPIVAYNMECVGFLGISVNPDNSNDSVIIVNTESRGYKSEEHLYYLKTGNIEKIKDGREKSEYISLIDHNGNISKTTKTIYDNGYSRMNLTIFLDSIEYSKNIKG